MRRKPPSKRCAISSNGTTAHRGSSAVLPRWIRDTRIPQNAFADFSITQVKISNFVLTQSGK